MTTTMGPDKRCWFRAGFTVLAAAIWLGGPSTAGAQRDSTPTSAYYSAFDLYYSGRYSDALKMFRNEGRGAIKNGVTLNHWIDSICYHAMSGECYYQVGQFPKALEHYTSALQLYLMYSDWMVRAQFPSTVRASASGRQIPWGRSTRPTRPAAIPDQIMIAQGDFNAQQKVREGGVVTPPVLFPLHVKEIVRATTLAMRRWRELMGPASAYDPLSSKLVAALSRNPGPLNHWSESWTDIELALAYAANGNDVQARSLLERGSIVAGEFDHDLTCVALLELGRIALSSGDLEAAAAHFEEATYSAGFYNDIGVLEEAFRLGTITHLLANKAGVYPPLEAAAAWAKVKGFRQLQVSLTLLAAENSAALGQTRQAGALLDIARPLIGNRDMGQGRIGARYNYLSALVRYQEGKVPAGDEVLAGALAYLSGGGSFWLFHIGMADKLVGEGTASEREAMTLYETVLRDPTTADWASDPMESLSVLVVPHPLPFEHWFEIALARKENEVAVEIADALRRHRFLSTQPLGGRLLSLRWLLEGPSEGLDERATQQRQDILTRYGEFDELAQQSQRLRAELSRAPLAPEEPDEQKSQEDKLAELAAACAAQERLLREIALRREPAPLLFPPRLSTKDLMARLPERQAVLIFLATSNRMHAFLIAKNKYAGGSLGAASAPKKQLAGLLRQLGNFESNYQMPLSQLKSDAWKRPAQELFAALFKGSKIQLPGEYEELIIVPDGLLWYLPFEALQVAEGKQTRSLISKCRVRYVPTASLALGDSRGRRSGGMTAVVMGKLFPQDDEALAQNTLDQLARAVPGTVAVPPLLPASSAIYSSLFDRLVVLDDLGGSSGGPYDWAPISYDRGKPGGALGDWLSLPWNGPDQVILPGFHTPAENSLKKGGTGEEIFLSLCGLMGSGSRTVLLSRWRTGGQTSYELIREFVQELPHTTAAEAWQRSIFLAGEMTLDPELEPRIDASNADDLPGAGHPFFWAGYLLADTGTPAQPTDEPADEPAPMAARQEPEAAADGAADEPEQPAVEQPKKAAKPPKGKKAKELKAG